MTGFELKCPWHYAVFDVRTGKVSDQTTWATDLDSYPVKIDESTDNVSVKLKIPQEEATPEKKQGKALLKDWRMRRNFTKRRNAKLLRKNPSNYSKKNHWKEPIS